MTRQLKHPSQDSALSRLSCPQSWHHQRSRNTGLVTPPSPGSWNKALPRCSLHVLYMVSMGVTASEDTAGSPPLKNTRYPETLCGDALGLCAKKQSRGLRGSYYVASFNARKPRPRDSYCPSAVAQLGEVEAEVKPGSSDSKLGAFPRHHGYDEGFHLSCFL